VLKAVHDHGDLLRASIASEGNDYRLGANEAPPAIISVFTGSALEKVLSRFKREGLTRAAPEEREVIDLNLTKILAIAKDPTDRNRTSPFSFTGNRFEFRGVGASANCAAPMTVLNTIVAGQLQAFAAAVDGARRDHPTTEAAMVSVLQGYMDDVERIVFNGNGYSRAWEEEAAARGLPNKKTTPAAIQAMISPRAKQLFAEQGVLNERELHSRYDVLLERYVTKVSIQADLFHELCRTHILPAAYEAVNKLSETYRNLKELGLQDRARAIVEQATLITDLTEALNQELSQLMTLKASADGIGDLSERAQAYADRVRPRFEQVRTSIDRLEVCVDDKIWALPKYRELLFVR
jgi:glutamine synthetase